MAGGEIKHQPGIYGSKEISSPSNIPGSRVVSISWTDLARNFWLFGGSGFGYRDSQGELNDLWQYEFSTREWIRIAGSEHINQDGVYGIIRVSDTSNIPGARSSAISWSDNFGNLWMFGGEDFIDLWKIDHIFGAIDTTIVYKNSDDKIYARWSEKRYVDKYLVDISMDNFRTYIPFIEKFVISTNSVALHDLDPDREYFLRVQSANELGVSPYSETIKFIPSKMSDLEEPEIYVYTNPARDELHIVYSQARGDENKIQILDMAGKLRVEKDIEYINNNHIVLNVSGLHSGIYITRTQGEKTTVCKKIVVRR